jgi:hypothetical protein
LYYAIQVSIFFSRHVRKGKLVKKRRGGGSVAKQLRNKETVTQRFKIVLGYQRGKNLCSKIRFHAGKEITRQRLGLPECCEQIQEWIDNSRDVTIEKIAPAKEWTVKNPETPELKSYAVAPDARFWKNFPFNYPVEMKKSVNVENLKKYVAKC